MQSRIRRIELDDWSRVPPGTDWRAEVEDGQVLWFPRLAFALEPAEQALLQPSLLEPGRRNISLDHAGQLKGAAGDAAMQARVAALLARFSAQARALCRALFPDYDAHLRPAPASLRPAEVTTRRQSVRADDRRLHVDAFPSRPNRGERILRVFSNIDPGGRPRLWRVGEPFQDVAQRYLPQAKAYSPVQARLLNALGVTKSLRSEYDHLMLQLHDRMKADEAYQREAPQESFGFPAGSTWVCFSDQTVHAAMAGQYLLEQTLHLPVERQRDVAASPLAILTRLAGRPLRGAPLPASRA
jgi:hypothetical protein